MNFRNLEDLKKAGFIGFKKIEELIEDSSLIPRQKGVYLILFIGTKKPEFLNVGTGGYFKGKNPNISIDELNANWVNKSPVVYIGKAGKANSSVSLYSRLKQYLRFGQGFNVGHYGGRLIWQIRNSNDLIVCWKGLPSDDPRSIEKELIQMFISLYGKRPFANLVN